MLIAEPASGFRFFQWRIIVRLLSKDIVMRRSIIALGCVLLAGPVLAQSAGEKTGVNSALGISPTTTDFVKEAAISDMVEIQSSQFAQAPLSDISLRSLRQRDRSKVLWT